MVVDFNFVEKHGVEEHADVLVGKCACIFVLYIELRLPSLAFLTPIS
jgi:hypothetical protein